MDEFNPAYGMAKAALDKFAGKAAEKPAETFGHAYDFTIGRLDYYFKKSNLRRELNFEKYREELLSEMSKIPDDDFQEPSMSLIGPGLESSKYYIDDEGVRKMFAKLLAKSMDSRYNEKMSHSFVEVLKQLGPIDALLLKLIAEEEHVPTAKIITLSTGINGVELTDYFLLTDTASSESVQISLNNLKRLGLISIPQNSGLTPDKIYQPFYDSQIFKSLSENNYIKNLHDEYLRAVNVLGMDPEKIAKQNGVNPDELHMVTKYSGVDIVKSRSSLTSYGSALWEVCVTD